MRAALSGFSSYFLTWIVAVVVCVGLGTWIAARKGYPAARTAGVLFCCSVVVLCGSKLMYLAEARWFPFDDYVPLELRSSLHGFRIPGGVLLVAVLVPVICRIFGVSWRRLGDLEIPLLAIGVVLIRCGCFLNGCCFGRVTTWPWAVRFPRNTWAFRYHVIQGWVPATADVSLPVHPLQLYFALAAVAAFVVLLAWRAESSDSGQRQIVFYTLFFASTALLEPLRANRLQLNVIVVSLAAVTCGAMLAGSLMRRP